MTDTRRTASRTSSHKGDRTTRCRTQPSESKTTLSAASDRIKLIAQQQHRGMSYSQLKDNTTNKTNVFSWLCMTTWPRIRLREAVYSDRKCLDATQADDCEAHANCRHGDCEAEASFVCNKESGVSKGCIYRTPAIHNWEQQKGRRSTDAGSTRWFCVSRVCFWCRVLLQPRNCTSVVSTVWWHSCQLYCWMYRHTMLLSIIAN